MPRFRYSILLSYEKQRHDVRKVVLLGCVDHPRDSEDASACDDHRDSARKLTASAANTVFHGESDVYKAEHDKRLPDELDSVG